MSQKRLLAWSDSAAAGTGFGVVSNHILRALHNTGNYNIHHLAINHKGAFNDSIPWQVQPARLLTPQEPHGIKMFLEALEQNDYDFVWILNDVYVTSGVAKELQRIKNRYKSQDKRPPVFIYYYPVDCHVQPRAAGMIDAVDIAVCYTDHGREETLKTLPKIEHKLKQIPHGVDIGAYHPLPLAIQQTCKQKFYNVSPDTTVVINVNRNSTRKQIPYSMLAFREFKKIVPKSVMYIHSVFRDQGGDLRFAMEDLGLDPKTDIILPTKYNPNNPFPTETMNQIYNSGDMFLSTHLGEGWGLTITEAMAAGTPVVCPNNTCMPEQLGKNSERGYMYPCNDDTWIDMSGFRPKGLIPDIVEQMVAAYKAGPKQENPKVKLALDFAKSHTWNNITVKWVDLFEELSNVTFKSPEPQYAEEV